MNSNSRPLLHVRFILVFSVNTFMFIDSNCYAMLISELISFYYLILLFVYAVIPPNVSFISIQMSKLIIKNKLHLLVFFILFFIFVFYFNSHR